MLSKITGTAALLTGLYLTQKDKTKCCGIIGILSESRQNIGPSLSMGVELLKNRGYDSAGIVSFAGQKGNVDVTLIKQAQQANQSLNCIERLVQKVSKQITKSHIGIGHTRWATCGEKVQKNAHPHYDNTQTIFLVHNGIIGGHSQIKKKYLQGIKFNSDTDTEVVAQLIGKFKAEGIDTFEAIKKAEEIMKQTSNNPQWGIVIMDKDQPNKMWTTTKGSPILIGMNSKEFFVASQSIAFKKQADSYFVTTDGQIWELEVSKIQQIQAKLQKQGRLIKVSEQDKIGVLVSPPEPFKSFYSYEIRQQGTIVFNPEFERVQSVAFGPFLTFIACGSSYYAALASQFFFKKLNTFKKVTFFDPVQLVKGDISEQETIVLISQSGQTKDLINVVESCHSISGVKTIGIINVEGSTLARKVDFPIYIKVGREVSVAATKSMFHQCLNLIELSFQVATKKQSAPIELIQEMREDLRKVPDYVTQTIHLVQEECDIVANLLHSKQSIYILAMRQTMPIAKEAALKIKQLNYIHAEALGACEMKHGPIALIESDKPKQTAVILFILDNETFEVCANAFDQMSSRNALVILVTDCKQKVIQHYQVQQKQQKKQIEKRKSQQGQNVNIEFKQKDPQKEFIFIEVPKLKHFSCLLTLIPMQILVEKIGNIKGINPDMPRNLAKTVTV